MLSLRTFAVLVTVFVTACTDNNTVHVDASPEVDAMDAQIDTGIDVQEAGGMCPATCAINADCNTCPRGGLPDWCCIIGHCFNRDFCPTFTDGGESLQGGCPSSCTQDNQCDPACGVIGTVHYCCRGGGCVRADPSGNDPCATPPDA